jgi:hypothetical protein
MTDECRPPEGPYTADVIPMGDKSMQWFIDALYASAPISRARATHIVHQCWRDIHNAVIAEPPADG